MALLLDTNVAIGLRDSDAGVLSRVSSSPELVAISLVTLIELEGGTAAHGVGPDRRAALLEMLVDVEVAPLDRAVVETYGAIVRRSCFSRARVLDRLIAATAIVNDWKLATANVADFRDFPGLKLEVWPARGQ